MMESEIILYNMIQLLLAAANILVGYETYETMNRELDSKNVWLPVGTLESIISYLKEYMPEKSASQVELTVKYLATGRMHSAPPGLVIPDLPSSDMLPLPQIIRERAPIEPFRTIQFELPFDAKWVKVAIFNHAGERIRDMRYGPTEKGAFTVFWDGENNEGERVAVGLYFATITTNYSQVTQRVPHGGPWGCEEDLVRAGYSLRTAYRYCLTDSKWVEKSKGIEKCMETVIREGGSWEDAFDLCEIAPEMPKPQRDGDRNGAENEIEREEKKEIPMYVWAIAGIYGFLLLRGELK